MQTYTVNFLINFQQCLQQNVQIFKDYGYENQEKIEIWRNIVLFVFFYQSIHFIGAATYQSCSCVSINQSISV